MLDDERHARTIIGLMRMGNTRAGEIMMLGAVMTNFMRPDKATRAQFDAGIEYAQSVGWIEFSGSALKLTAAGARI